MARDRIFVSYRHEDSRAWTARLVDDLRDHFGRDRVYRDIDSNRAGQDYVQQIRDALAASQVMIAVIGPQQLVRAIETELEYPGRSATASLADLHARG